MVFGLLFSLRDVATHMRVPCYRKKKKNIFSKCTVHLLLLAAVIENRKCFVFVKSVYFFMKIVEPSGYVYETQTVYGNL